MFFLKKGLFVLPTQPSNIVNLYARSFFIWRTIFLEVLFLSFVCATLTVFFGQYLVQELNIAQAAMQFHKNVHYDYTKIALFFIFNVLIALGIYAAMLIKINGLVKNQPLTPSALFKKVAIKFPLFIGALVISSISVLVGLALFIVPGFYVIGMIFVFYTLVALEDNNIFK